MVFAGRRGKIKRIAFSRYSQSEAEDLIFSARVTAAFRP